MCFKPVTIHVHPNSPQYIKDYYGKTHNVPCGRCVECRTKMINDWTFRLTKEYEIKGGSFITLTYSDENLIYNEKDKQSTLHYPHIQKLWKILRKKGLSFKYFAVGEYGSKTKRPHYHALVFGYNAKDANFQSVLIDSWKFGNVHFGEINEASIKYTLKYCLKSAFSADDVASTVIAKKVQGFDRVAEKAMMSKGLGLSLLENVHTYDYYVENADNINVRFPRYYIKKILNDADKEKRFKAILEKNKQDKRTEEEKYLFKQNINSIKLKYLKKQLDKC